MSDEENKAANSEDAADDLERVYDIGPHFAKALHVLGIHTFAELASYSAEELSALMSQNTEIKITPERIKTRKWLEQAKDLAAKKQKADEGVHTDEEEHDEWKQHAGFSIFFDYKLDEQGQKHWHTRVWKTTTYHEESGEVKELDGVETSSWVNWILEKSGLDAEKLPEQPEADDELEILSAPSCQVEIQEIEVRPTANTSPATIQASIHFTSTFPESNRHGDGIFHVELRVVQIESGISIYAGQTYQSFDPEITNHISNIEFPIPDETGQYQLIAVIHSFTEKNLLAVSDSFTFKVVP